MVAFAFFEAATTGLLTCSVTYLNELGLSGQDIVYFILTSTLMGAVGAAGSRRLVPLFGVKRSLMGVLAVFVLLTVIWMFTSERKVAFAFAFGFGVCYGVVHPVQRTGRAGADLLQPRPCPHHTYTFAHTQAVLPQPLTSRPKPPPPGFASLVPGGQEAEYAGLFTFSGMVLSWAVPLLFVVLNETTGSVTFGLFAPMLFHSIGFIILSTIDFDAAREPVLATLNRREGVAFHTHTPAETEPVAEPAPTVEMTAPQIPMDGGGASGGALIKQEAGAAVEM